MGTEPKFRRVLLKISGEALAGDQKTGLNFNVIGRVCDVIKTCTELGVQVGVVIGGGNFWRGVKNGEGKMARSRADHMGMLATVMNCLAVSDVMEQKGIPVRVQTAVEMPAFAEHYTWERAIAHLEEGKMARTFEVPDDEDDQLWFKNYNLLTAKPTIYAANVAEDDLADDGASNPHAAKVREMAKEEGAEVFVICAQIEQELSELSDEEKEQAKKDMANMLDYIDTLNELDTSGVEPMSHVFPVNNVFREDVVTNGDDREEILANAPEAKEGAFVVPKTFD